MYKWKRSNADIDVNIEQESAMHHRTLVNNVRGHVGI